MLSVLALISDAIISFDISSILLLVNESEPQFILEKAIFQKFNLKAITDVLFQVILETAFFIFIIISIVFRSIGISHILPDQVQVIPEEKINSFSFRIGVDLVA